jgi:hypothetical protein
MARTFKDFLAWRKTHDLLSSVYELTATFPKPETQGLSAQMRRDSSILTRRPFWLLPSDF